MATNNAGGFPTGASGTILRGGGVGSNPTFSTATYPTAAGTSGNVLTSDGTNWNSTTPAAGAGAIVFLDSKTPSAAASAAFTSGIDSTYSTYLFQWQQVVAATNAVSFIAEVSDDGGSTWKTASYTSNFFRFNSGGTGVNTITTAILLSESSTYSSTNSDGGHMWLRNIGTSKLSTFDGTGGYPTSAGAGAHSSGVIGGTCPASLTINAIRFRMSSGNISGFFVMYGVKQS